MFRNKEEDVRATAATRQWTQSLSQLQNKLQSWTQFAHRVTAGTPADTARGTARGLWQLSAAPILPGVARQHAGHLAVKLEGASVAESMAAPAATGASLAAFKNHTIAEFDLACSVCDRIAEVNEEGALQTLHACQPLVLGAVSAGVSILQHAIGSCNPDEAEWVAAAAQACDLHGPDSTEATMSLFLQPDYSWLLQGQPLVAEFHRLAGAHMDAVAKRNQAWQLLKQYSLRVLPLPRPVVEAALRPLRTLQQNGAVRVPRDLTPEAARLYSRSLLAINALYEVECALPLGAKIPGSWQELKRSFLIPLQHMVRPLYRFLPGNGSAGAAAALPGGDSAVGQAAQLQTLHVKVDNIGDGVQQLRSEVQVQHEAIMDILRPLVPMLQQDHQQQQQQMLQQDQQQQQPARGAVVDPAAAAARGAHNMDLF